MTGASPHGQGEETTFAQIAADELGVSAWTTCIVLHGDTAIVQYGIGTFGSRGTAIGGTALYFALQDLKAKIKKFGEMLLESDDVTFAGGVCTCNKIGQDGDAGADRRRVLSRHEAAAAIPSRAWWRRTSGSRRTSRSRSARTSW